MGKNGKQLIISISREYGSGGHEVGVKLAEKIGYAFYDRNLLEEIAAKKNVDTNSLVKYDNMPKRKFFSRTVRGYTNSPEQNVAELQFALLKSKAVDGDSFVIIGRCSDSIFNGIAPVVRIFLTGSSEAKINRIMERRKMSRNEAIKVMGRHDKNRKSYHDYFCRTSWGSSSSYDLIMRTDLLGIDGTVEFLADYIEKITRK